LIFVTLCDSLNTLPAAHLSNRRYAAAGEIHAGSTARQRWYLRNRS